jgi:hypothetical protein
MTGRGKTYAPNDSVEPSVLKKHVTDFCTLGQAILAIRLMLLRMARNPQLGIAMIAGRKWGRQ